MTNRKSKIFFRNLLYQSFDLRYYMPYFRMKIFLTPKFDLFESNIRIIISDDVLNSRISDLCKAFISRGYPTSMVQRISKKVLNTKRDLSVIVKKSVINNDAVVSNNVRIVSILALMKCC